ncbi:hypothetical protein Lesp01_59030 [Lentzea sp. NBRC 102530]|nr:hypothetical protein Lesp01_59030 [Lentzea sp. NBRC 102530]
MLIGLKSRGCKAPRPVCHVGIQPLKVKPQSPGAVEPAGLPGSSLFGLAFGFAMPGFVGGWVAWVAVRLAPRAEAKTVVTLRSRLRLGPELGCAIAIRAL